MQGPFVYDTVSGWLKTATHPIVLWYVTLVPVVLLVRFTIAIPHYFKPFTSKEAELYVESEHSATPGDLMINNAKEYKRIAVTLLILVQK